MTAVECGSLTAAAEKLDYTQSGLTHMMNSLEDELGLSLLIRSKAGVRLSPAGEALLEDIRAVTKATDTLLKNAEELKEKNFSSIRVGAYSSVARHWLPSILAEYKTISPKANTSVSMKDIRATFDAVKNDELDIAIVSYQEELMSGLSWIELKDDELVAVLPGAHLPEEGDFPVSYFKGMDFLMPSGGFDMDIMPVFSGIKEKDLPVFSYTNLEDAAIVSMVAHGLGVSIMSRLVMRGMSENVAVVPLKPRGCRRLGIIVKERHSGNRSIKRFIACAKSVLDGMQ